ncbi:MAG: 4-hydroxybenzoate octaprenyltransferase, partial [Magnetospirillum sp.]|nr:4-hydroxybenzoate octaprenyltransferase [Magnetospirillum sp.]
VKSTALRLGDATVTWLWLFYPMALALIGAAGWAAGLGWGFWPFLALAGAHLVWQIRQVDIHDGADCLAKFKSNRHFGWLVLAAIVAGRVL